MSNFDENTQDKPSETGVSRDAQGEGAEADQDRQRLDWLVDVLQDLSETAARRGRADISREIEQANRRVALMLRSPVR